MKGLLFKPKMIEATQREVNPKTQTRRLIAQPDFEPVKIEHETKGGITIVTLHGEREEQKKKIRIPCAKGETVYVKEPWSPEISTEKKWKSPMFMEARFARIFLEISDVRIERVADISDADCLAEGIQEIETSQKFYGGVENEDPSAIQFYKWYSSPREAFRWLWNSINAEPKLNKKLGLYFSYPFQQEDKDCSGKKRKYPVIEIVNPWVAVITFGRVKYDSI